MANMNPVLAAAQKSNAATANAAQTIERNLLSMENIYADIASTFERVSQNAAVVESTKQAGELETQAASDAIAASLGVDVRESSNRLLGLNEQLLRNTEIRDNALAAVNEKQRVGLFDDPLQWVMNQLTVNDDIARYNAADAEVDNTANKISLLTAASDKQVASQKAIQHSVSKASADAATENAASAAHVLALKAKLDGYKNNSDGVVDVLKLSAQDLQTAYTIYNAQTNAEEAGRSAERLAMAREQQNYQRQIWDAQVAEKNMKQLAQEEQLKILNIGRVNRGAPPLEGAGAARFLTLRGADGSIAAEFQDDYKRGSMTLTQGQKVVAIDPATLAETIGTSGIAFTPAQLPIKGMMEEVTQQVAKDLAQGQKGVGPLAGKITKDTVANHFNIVTRSVLSQYSNKIVPGDSSNPYNIPSVGDIIKYPNVANIPLVTNFLAPLAATPDGDKILNDPARLASAVQVAVQQGKITFNEAVTLPAIYRVGTEVNNQAKQFKALGLPENHSYKVRIPKLSGWGEAVVDMTDQAFWARYVGQGLATEMNKKFSTTSGIFNPEGVR